MKRSDFFSGKLDVSGITASGCHLNWDVPEDDGGKPITGYVVEKMDMDTGRWDRSLIFLSFYLCSRNYG